MAKIQRLAGATSVILQVFIQDSSSTTGAGLTGLVFNTASLTAYFHRDTDTTATAISLVTMTTGTFTSSGFKEIDATNMPGWYQLCPPNTAMASGAKSVGIHLKGATNMAPLPLEIELTAVDNQSTGFGLVNASANTVQFAGQTITAGAGVTIPSSIASPTNITAGTITTTTNLTNAPTAGDFTATMKTSIGTAVAASAVASVTGNVGGNVTGSVGSVVGAVGSVTGAVGSVTGSVGSVTGLTASNLDTTVSSRMATYTQPTGFLAATFPTGTVANTTNITAGTMTTTTNLTNAPTAGDFTSTMKTSLGTAAAASAVASVTGNVGGNVTGSVGSVVGAVGSVTGNVGGNVTGTVASVVDISTTGLAESSAVPASNATPLQKINFVATMTRNKITQTATTQLLRNDADSSTVGTSTVSDDGTTATRGKFS